MRHVPFSALALLLLTALPALAAPEKRVWRVDSVIATQAGGTVVVEVKGAVQSGGWSRPRLKAGHGDARTLVVEFLAQPPSPGTVVIEGLLPVTARITINAAHGAVAVKALGQANEVTAQILTPPEHAMQDRRDLRHGLSLVLHRQAPPGARPGAAAGYRL